MGVGIFVVVACIGGGIILGIAIGHCFFNCFEFFKSTDSYVWMSDFFSKNEYENEDIPYEYYFSENESDQ